MNSLVDLPATAASEVWVTHDDRVSILDTETNIVRQQIVSGGQPFAIVFSPDGALAYVSDVGRNLVIAYDTRQYIETGRVGVGQVPAYIALSPDGRMLYAANWYDGTLSVVDTASMTVVAVTPVGVGPWGIVTIPGSGNVLVANAGDGTITVLGPDGATHLDRILVGNNPQTLAVDSSGTRTYTAVQDRGSIVELDAEAHRVVREFFVADDARTISLSPENRYAYVSSASPAGLTRVVDLASGDVVATLEVGGSPSSIAVAANLPRAYVASTGTGALSIIDTEAKTVVQSIDLGDQARGVAVTKPRVDPVRPSAFDKAYNTDEDVSLIVTPGLLADDNDPVAEGLSAVPVTGPANGRLVMNPDGSFTYTPDANFNGDDSFTYKASNGTAESDIATVRITVAPVNDPPTIAPLADETTTESIATGPISFTVGDIETAPATLTLAATSLNSTLVPANNITFAGSDANRTVTVEPVAGLTGLADIIVTVTDANGDAVSDTFRITVNPRKPSTTGTPTSSLNPSNYGQFVTFTTTVSSAGGTPTGTVEFFDGGASLGLAALSGGTASLTTSAVAAGTRSITAKYQGDRAFAPGSSEASPQTVNKASATVTFTSYPYSPQYSDLVWFKATVSPATINGRPPATSARFKVGTQVMGTAPLVPNPATGTAEAKLTVPLVETTPPGQLKPGSKLATVEFVDVDPSVTVPNRTLSQGIRQEDARTVYTGPAKVWTACSTCSTATIRLEAQVSELADGNPGDIRNAMVVFINRATGASIGVGKLDASKSTAAVAYYYYDWSVSISGKEQTFTIGTSVTNYYTRNSTTENGTTVVAKP